MTPQDLHVILTSSGVPCRLSRTEVAVQVCVFCSNGRWNLECNAEKGVYHAWCCKRGGRLDVLLRSLTGQEYQIAVQKVVRDPTTPPPKVADFKTMAITEVGSALAYLTKRGITAEVARFYGIVFVNQADHPLHNRIAIPARDFWTGNIEGWIGRSYTNQQPKYMTTLTRRIITGWRHRDPLLPHVVVEGPLDGVAVHRAGFHAAVLSGIGGERIEEWAARLPSHCSIVLMLDGDAVEQAQRLYWQITAVRSTPSLITLPPEQDPASIGPARLAQIVADAVSKQAVT